MEILNEHNHLRIRPSKGHGFYLEVLNAFGIEFGIDLSITPHFCLYIILPYLRIEFGWIDIEEDKALEKFFSPLTEEERKNVRH